MKRSTPLPRSKPEVIRAWIQRSREKNRLKRSRIRRVSPDKARKRERRGIYGEKHRWHATQQCWCDLQGFGHECKGQRVGHHDPTVNAGGSDLQEATLCWMHHTGPRGIHEIGRGQWESRYGPMQDAVDWYSEKWKEAQ